MRDELLGLGLRVPAHMPPAPESKLLECPRAPDEQGTAFRKLRVQVASCIHSLVASQQASTTAHRAALAAALAAAAAELSAIQGLPLDEDLEPIVTFDDHFRLKLPDADDLQGRLPAYVALFHPVDAQFMVARIDSMTSEVSGSSLPSAGAKAAAKRFGVQKTVTKVDVTHFKAEGDGGDFVEDDKEELLCFIPTPTPTPPEPYP